MKGTWLVLAICVAGCAPPEESRSTSGADEAAIMAASQAFSAAYVYGDTTAIRNLYTEDAVLLPAGREIRGRDRITRFFSPNRRRTNVSHSMVSSELKVTGDLAVDIGHWSNTWRIGDAEPQDATERYLIVWRRCSDGKWRIEYDMWHRPSD